MRDFSYEKKKSKSAGHCYQHAKSIAMGNSNIANQLLAAPTSMDAKILANRNIVREGSWIGNHDEHSKCIPKSTS